MNKAGIAYALGSFFFLTGIARAHELPSGSAAFDAEIVLEGFQHRLQKGMTVQDDGLSKTYAYTAGVSTRPSQETEIGETLYLTAAVRPNDFLYADAQLSILGNYADRLWRPINDLHRQEAFDERVRFMRGEASYRSNSVAVRLFQGKAYTDWRTKGDLFGLLPAQYEIERYLNFSGHAVPRAVEGSVQTGAGEFGVMAGPEVIWGGGDAAFARYNVTKRAVHMAVIYKSEEAVFAEEDENLQAVEATLATEPLGRVAVKFGVLYQPFRLDRPFQKAERTDPGRGTFGSSYNISNDVTGKEDAWGATLQLTYFPKPLIDRLDWGVTYLRPVAGNKEEVFASAHKMFSKFFSSTLNYTYRRPIIGPLPLLYEGTHDNPGALLLSPRGRDDPFWVTWQTEGAMADNREGHILKWTFVQDATPNTWLFLYDPHEIETYNLNPAEDSRYAYVVQYRMEYYPTATDLTFYHNEEGRVVWEQPYQSGAWPTRRPVHTGLLMTQARIGSLRNVFIVKGGESLATGSPAYTTRTDKFKPATTLLCLQNQLNWGPYMLEGQLSRHEWGPEDFQRRFGETFDRLYRFRFERSFRRTWSKIGVSYTRAREEDNRFLAASLGGFDEWGVYFTQRFGVILNFKQPPRAIPRAHRQEPEPLVVRQADYSVRVQLDRDTLIFEPDASPKVAIQPFTENLQDAARWYIEIREDLGNTVVKSFSGYTLPPRIFWDGTDADGDLVEEGPYRIEFGVMKAGDIVKAEAPIRVIKPKSDLKVVESSEGLKISLKSQVLFAVGKADLKPAAKAQLDEVIALLKAYPDQKVRIEGHSDSVGQPERNKQLSLRRAQGVMDYLVGQGGLNKERFEIVGWGAEKPTASNKTAAGREANRRVEIIILKEGYGR